MSPIVKKSVMPVFTVTAVLNFMLFAVKLYIGLSANSISIYSDGINNLFDFFSCIVAVVCFFAISKSRDRFSRALTEKTEIFISLALSCVIFAVGAIFLYNSAERLMYPTPVWFAVNYFYILLFTAAVKLAMFFFLRFGAERLDSEVVRLMSVDSLSDFFITAVTVLTLLISKNGSYSFDAWGGIVISLFIIAAAVKNIRQNTAVLLGVPGKEKRERAEALLEAFLKGEDFEAEASLTGEKRLYVKVKKEFDNQELEELKKKLYNETGLSLYFIKQEEIK